MPRTHGHDPKRAILYARVSTDEQARSGYSLTQQLEALRDHADREGYEILEEVSDPGQCGASLEWPGMNRVRGLVAAGGSAGVPAQDRDRCAREPAYHYLLRREFEEHGTRRRSVRSTTAETRARKGNSRTVFSTSSPSSRGPRPPRPLGGAGSASSGGFSKSTGFPGPLSPVQERGSADQAHEAGSFLYTSGEGELLSALALEGVAPLRVPVVLASEQDQPLAALTF